MRADLFCRVIDNYGDIGVCWRLARRLAHGRGWRVRLWVDDLASFARIEPSIVPTLERQQTLGIDVVRWAAQSAHDLEPGEVVIEAFACHPPLDFVARMKPGKQAWINLEYLSAEAWVESCHGLPSPQPDGLIKYFFFPGFTPATGGLLREPNLLAERDAWRADTMARQALLARLGLPASARVALNRGARLCTLFCYPNAPVDALLRSLAFSTPAVLLVPQGVAPALTDGLHGQIHVVRIPFVSQPDFDRLLWSADFNLIRGEDSFVRALWAGRPMLWHIYPQDDAAHLVKLDAWLAHYDAPAPIPALMRAWNGAAHASAAFDASLAAALVPTIWRDWTDRADAWSRKLAYRPDLADTLADFCTQILTRTPSACPAR